MTNPGVHRHAALPLAVLLVSACADLATVPDTPPAAVMLGEWSYHCRAMAQGQPSLNAGLSVTISIDSAAAMRFWGHVVSWFAGDVGVPPTHFGVVSGSVDQDRGVQLLIPSTTSDGLALAINGELDGDVIVVRESWAGTAVGPFPPGDRFQRLP